MKKIALALGLFLLLMGAFVNSRAQVVVGVRPAFYHGPVCHPVVAVRPPLYFGRAAWIGPAWGWNHYYGHGPAYFGRPYYHYYAGRPGRFVGRARGWRR